MQLDENNNIYLCFKNSPGVYKVSGGADRENTPTELITGSETLVERGNGIFIHTDGSIYISCSETHKIIKYENGTFTVIAGDGTDNNVNSTNPLQASFSSPRGMCFTAYNDLLICDSQPKFTADYGSLRVMGGNKPFTYNGIANIPQYSYIPLQFWFCRNPGLALPLIALQYNEVKISIKLAKSLNGITQLEAWGDYIFIDSDEKRRFSELSHEYLIEQVQYSNNIKLGTNIITNNTPQEVISVTELFFNHPIKEILWSIYQHTDNSQGIIKACSSTNEGGNQNIEVKSSYMQFNGEDRMEERTGNYYTKVQRYQRHTGAGVGITRIGVNSTDISSDQVISKWFPKTTNIHIYSFSLNPDEYQPSGTCNFSRLDNALIHNTFNTASVNGVYNYSINIYAVNYNILRITNGMGGLAYSN
jgi:hypothetical protein